MKLKVVFIVALISIGFSVLTGIVSKLSVDQEVVYVTSIISSICFLFGVPVAVLIMLFNRIDKSEK